MEEIQMVPLAAYEAEAERSVRMVKYLSAGWVVTALALIFVILCVILYSEVETEAVEDIETVTSTVTQDTGEAGGINAYAGGDFNGNATNSNNTNYYSEDSQDD